MKNSFTKITGIIGLLAITLLLATSCKKENTIIEPIKVIDLGELSDRDAFAVYQKVLAPLHSEGLEFIFKKIKESHENINRTNELTDEFMKTAKIKSIVSDYTVNYLDESVTNQEQANKEIETLNKLCFDFVDKIHASSLDNLTLEELKKETAKILDDRQFQSLSKARKHAILTGIAVYEDSYGYWIKHLEDWNDETNSEPTVLKFWDRLKQIAKADLAGGIGGAVGGAVVGAFAGGVGAGPGAVGGAVGGAISGSVTSALN